MSPEEYSAYGLTPPQVTGHGTFEDVKQNLKEKVKHGPWKQQGNVITCVCDIGSHSSFIPTSKMLVGTDEDGMPQFKNVV